MRKIVLIFLTILIVSCELYLSDYPISNLPYSAISEQIIGQWVFVVEEDEILDPISEIQVFEWGNNEYLIQENIITKGERGKSRPFKVWNSVINGTEYINVKSFYNEGKFFIFKYRKGKSNTLEVNYLIDTLLDKQFVGEIDFQKFVLNNQSEFDSYFGETWHSYQRWDSLSWGRVNEKWLNQISQIDEIETSIAVKDFEKLADNDLDELKTIINISKDSIISKFNDYHLIRGDAYWKEKPILYKIEKDDGEIIRFAMNGLFILDITNNHSYVKTRK